MFRVVNSLKNQRLPSTLSGYMRTTPRNRFISQSYRLFASAINKDLSGFNSKVTAVLGAQWGDEGKGKLVDILAARYDYICRFNGGSNAGHTIVTPDGKKFPFHLLPCGLLYEDKMNIIGNGVVIHVPTMFKELANLDKNGINWEGRLKISTRAHLLFDAHQVVDGRQENALSDAQKIGTTGRGIGPCYSSKTQRNGVRAGELADWAVFEEKYRKLIASMQSQYSNFEYDVEEELSRYKEYAKVIVPMLVDTVSMLREVRADGNKTILAEGANATLLDIDFGTYPFVTSSSTAVGGISTGLGLPPNAVETRFGIVKAYTTRVGSGPFPTELFDDVGKELRDVGHEYGTTTGRPRRCGWLDIPVVQYAHAINDFTSINLTKLDVLSGLKEIKIATHYTINGKRLPTAYMPSLLKELESVQVVYETMPGWECDISKVRTFNELPKEAQNYIKRIEELLQVPISYIGVGPGRLEMASKFD